MGSEIPTAVWSGEFQIGDVVMKCHILSDGQRIVEDESANAFWGAMWDESLPPGELDAFLRWMVGAAN